VSRKKPTNDQKLAERVNGLFKVAEEGLKKEHDRWRENYKFWNNSFPVKRPSKKDSPVIPYIFMLGDGIQSILTANRPKFSFHPQESDDTITADAYNQIIGDYYWDDLELQEFGEQIIWWALNISGSGIAEYGVHPISGKLYFNVLNSFFCYPDPGSTRLHWPDGRAAVEFFGTKSPVSIQEIERIWPHSKGKVNPQDNLMTPDEEMQTQVTFYNRASLKSENLVGVSDPYDARKTYGRALVGKMWINEPDTIPIPFDENETDIEVVTLIDSQVPLEARPGENHPNHIQSHREQIDRLLVDINVENEVIELIKEHVEDHLEFPQKKNQLKYPKGRIITVVDQLVLEDKPAPLGLNFIKLDLIPNHMRFWGQTLQTYIQSLQVTATRRLQQASDINDRAANPREFYSTASGYQPQKSRGLPAERIPVKGNPRSAVFVDSGVGPNSSIFNELKLTEQLIEKIFGWSEVAQGIFPSGASGVSIQKLQEATGTRIRKSARHFEFFLVHVARELIGLLQFDDPQKAFKILNKEKVEESIKLIDLDIKEKGMFNVRITAGSTLPTTRIEKEERAMKLGAAGYYDQQAVLESINDPMAKEVLERTSEIEKLKEMVLVLSEQVKNLNSGSGGSNGKPINKIPEFEQKITGSKIPEQQVFSG